MALSFNGAQVQVDELIQQHPDGYRDDEKKSDKIEEEAGEVADALALYLQSPTPENLTALKIEIGDELFALICLANTKGIALDECFNLMMEKNEKRAKNKYQK